MKIDTHNYGQMRDWLAHMTPEAFPEFSPEADPVLCLDRTAATSPANARKGLAMVIGDIVEITDLWTAQKVSEVDNALKSKGLPTLSEIRVEQSKVLRRVLRREKISNDVEYYAVRNVADHPEHGSDMLWKLLSDYEVRCENQTSA